MPNLKITFKNIRLVVLYAGCLGFGVYGLIELGKMVFAEQSGGSPESNATSRVKTAYDWLLAKGANYGSTDAGDWSNNWGTYWNRIMEASAWEPDGTANAGDVVSGKTFYAGNGDRTQKEGTLALTGDATTAQVADGATFYSDSFTKLEGTASLAPDYSLQILNEWDNYKEGDYTGDESTWTQKTASVYQDDRTGLYWSQAYTNDGSYYTNMFPNGDHSACPFFDGTTDQQKITARTGYDGLDADCGDAINFCGSLELAIDGGVAKTDWYLPTQNQLMQAYLDGMYNQAGADFTTTEYFWSSSEVSGISKGAWYAYLASGFVFDVSKVSTSALRCVRGDL